MTNLKDMIAVKGGGVSKKDLLGTLTFFTVPDRPVSGAKLKRLWQSEGLDETLVPDTRQPTHVFQAACRSVETRRANGSDRDAEIQVAEVVDNATECVYQVTRLLRDRENRIIDYPPSMRVVFEKSNARIAFDPLEPHHYDALKHLTKQIEVEFDANGSKVPGQKIRNAIRDTFKTLHAENMRKSGGVYFVPIDGADTLESISRVLEQLYGGEASLAMIPMMNSSGARDLVREHHTAGVIDRADEMIAELAALNKRDKDVRSDKMNNIVQQRRELAQHRKRYVDLLGENVDELREKERVLDAQLEKLLERAYA